MPKSLSPLRRGGPSTKPPIPAPPPQGVREQTEQAAIAAFARGFSLEATRPSAGDVAALAQSAPRGTRVYLSAVPARPSEEAIAAAILLRGAGFEPVPHVAVRSFIDAAALDRFLARMCAEAGVQRALVIAGDRDTPAGEFRSSAELIDSGLLQRHGIREIGIAGYPDGHPRLSQQELDRALADKVAAAEVVGIAVHIVTQFCFEASTILRWIDRLRAFGLEQPVRVGLAGPTNFATLLRYARRCGVRASAQGLARQAGLVRQLFALSTPDPIVRAMAHANGRLGDVAPHFFTFGGLARSARWAQAAADGRITLQNGEGFRVEPPAR
jgi:methylenetetrahydrofolate reductase (NADPH)